MEETFFYWLKKKIWECIDGGQALLQYGRRRLLGEREGVQGDWSLMVSTLGLFVLSPAVCLVIGVQSKYSGKN